MLKFSALRREVHVQNEDGTVSEEIKERTYDLKCNTQGRMIQVSVPATVPLKDYDYNAEVEMCIRDSYNYRVSSVSSTGDGRYKDESSCLCRVRAGSLSCGTELEGRIV